MYPVVLSARLPDLIEHFFLLEEQEPTSSQQCNNVPGELKINLKDLENGLLPVWHIIFCKKGHTEILGHYYLITVQILSLIVCA